MKTMLEGPLSAIQFDAVCTAEDIGSFKPAVANFDYLRKKVRDEFGIITDLPGGELLHVARSLYVDHATCKDIGMPSV